MRAHTTTYIYVYLLIYLELTHNKTLLRALLWYFPPTNESINPSINRPTNRSINRHHQHRTLLQLPLPRLFVCSSFGGCRFFLSFFFPNERTNRSIAARPGVVHLEVLRVEQVQEALVLDQRQQGQLQGFFVEHRLLVGMGGRGCSGRRRRRRRRRGGRWPGCRGVVLVLLLLGLLLLRRHGRRRTTTTTAVPADVQGGKERCRRGVAIDGCGGRGRGRCTLQRVEHGHQQIVRVVPLAVVGKPDPSYRGGSYVVVVILVVVVAVVLVFVVFENQKGIALLQLKVARKIHDVVFGRVPVQYHQRVFRFGLGGRRRRRPDGQRQRSLDVGFFPLLRFVVEVVQDDVCGTALYVGDGGIDAPLQQPEVGLLSGLFVDAKVDFCHA
mmetsp:Transcript_18448/g.38054  ORF Transcript_18448/g.38054 Transcript_18448/m.38054 type:complete len:383 (+) Transcript_18448:235-1383(+)